MIGLEVDESLRMFMPARRRGGSVEIRYDGTASLGHLVQSIGVPLSEVGRLRVGLDPVASLVSAARR